MRLHFLISFLSFGISISGMEPQVAAVLDHVTQHYQAAYTLWKVDYEMHQTEEPAMDKDEKVQQFAQRLVQDVSAEHRQRFDHIKRHVQMLGTLTLSNFNGNVCPSNSGCLVRLPDRLYVDCEQLDKEFAGYKKELERLKDKYGLSWCGSYSDPDGGAALYATDVEICKIRALLAESTDDAETNFLFERFRERYITPDNRPTDVASSATFLSAVRSHEVRQVVRAALGASANRCHSLLTASLLHAVAELDRVCEEDPTNEGERLHRHEIVERLLQLQESYNEPKDGQILQVTNCDISKSTVD